MGEVHRIHDENFEDVNAIAIRMEGLAWRLSFLSKITGQSERNLPVTDLEFTATMESLAREARDITERVADIL